MGTRNLTLVKSNHQTKVAQYGQWDGYPSGQGATVLNFLKQITASDSGLTNFKNKIDHLKNLTDQEVEGLWADFDVSDSGFVSLDTSEKFSNKYPHLHRDTGAKILQMIYNGDAECVYLDKDFLNDSLFCEWAYELDLDNNCLYVYKDGNNKIATFYFNDLPEEDKFVNTLTQANEY